MNTEDKVYAFDEAILESGLYKSLEYGNYILVTKSSDDYTQGKPCHNGVVFLAKPVIENNLGLKEANEQKMLQRCNSCIQNTYVKCENLDMFIGLKRNTSYE